MSRIARPQTTHTHMSLPLFNFIRTYMGWFVIVGTFTHYVAQNLYILLPPDALGLASTRQFTLRLFASITSVVLIAILLPLIVSTAAPMSRKIIHIIASIASIALSVSLIDGYDYTKSTSTASDKLLAILVASITVFVLIHALILLKQRILSDQLKSAWRAYSVAIVLFGIALVLHLALADNAPLDTVRVNFWNVFLDKESAILLFVSILALMLLWLQGSTQRVIYASMAALITLSSTTGVMTVTARNDYCTRLRNNLGTFMMHPPTTNMPRQTGVVTDIKAAIHAECDGSYDL